MTLYSSKRLAQGGPPLTAMLAMICMILLPTLARGARGTVFSFAKNGTVLELTVGSPTSKGKVAVSAKLSVNKNGAPGKVVGGSLQLILPDPTQGVPVAINVKPPIKNGALPDIQKNINHVTWSSVGTIKRGRGRTFEVNLLPPGLVGAAKIRRLSSSANVYSAVANVVFDTGAIVGLFVSSSAAQQNSFGKVRVSAGNGGNEQKKWGSGNDDDILTSHAENHFPARLRAAHHPTAVRPPGPSKPHLPYQPPSRLQLPHILHL